MEGRDTYPVKTINVNPILAYPVRAINIDVSQCGILTIQGNQPEAFSYPPTSYFLGVKAAGFAPHPGYGLLDKAGFPGARPSREQTDLLHQLLPLRTFLS